jgi:hypothetical protein
MDPAMINQGDDICPVLTQCQNKEHILRILIFRLRSANRYNNNKSLLTKKYKLLFYGRNK